jgi:hypothetical protein
MLPPLASVLRCIQVAYIYGLRHRNWTHRLFLDSPYLGLLRLTFKYVLSYLCSVGRYQYSNIVTYHLHILCFSPLFCPCAGQRYIFIAIGRPQLKMSKVQERQVCPVMVTHTTGGTGSEKTMVEASSQHQTTCGFNFIRLRHYPMN